MTIPTLPCSYTEVTRINSAYPPITSVSAITSGVVAQYIGDVEAEINGRISGRYALPLTVQCPILTAIATRETIYRIVVQRALIQFPPPQQGSHPLQVQHKDDQNLLNMIADGSIKLVDSSGAQIPADVAQLELYSTTKTYIPTFHEGPWPDMVQDPNKISDILSERDLD